MKRVKIGNGYTRSGYGRTATRKANVYLINGKAYAKDAATARTCFYELAGELAGYVQVNGHKNTSTGDIHFVQCSDHGELGKHLPYTFN